MRAQISLEYLAIIAILLVFFAIFLTFSFPSLPTQFKKEWGNFYNFEPVDWVLYENGTFSIILRSKLPYNATILQINSSLGIEEISISPNQEISSNEMKNFTFQFSPKSGNYEINIKILYNETLTNKTKVDEGFVRWHT